MKRLNTTSVVILGVLLLGCLLAAYFTRDSGTEASPTAAARARPGAIDAPLLETARQIAVRAETTDEQDQAREALNLSDHERDQAFATALREAVAYRLPATGPLRDLTVRVNQLRLQMAADQERVAQLTKQSASGSSTDELDLTNAQLALDQDELDDAREDLARQGGDPHAVLERSLQEHEAGQHQSSQDFKTASPSPTATLIEQVRTWFALSDLNRQLLGAEQQAADQAASCPASTTNLRNR
jgi:hypothetical protein